MLSLRLVKPVDHAQIGHVYEHIFCMALSNYLKSRHLYAYLDYHISGRAYYSGIVEISLELYTPEAVKEKEAIYRLEPEFGQKNINSALIQILAEKRADVNALDTSIVYAKLRGYQSTPWQSFDTLRVENIAHHLKTRNGLELIRRDGRHFMILRQDIMLDTAFANRNKEKYWPSFFVLSSFLIKNLQDEIPDATSCYSYDDFGRYTHAVVKETNLYRVDRRQADTLTDEVIVTKKFIRDMVAHGCIGRLAAFLQSTDSSAPMTSPDIEELYRKTALLVGAAGWREIGTPENIKTVLEHTTIRFSLGKTKDSLDIAHLLKGIVG